MSLIRLCNNKPAKGETGQIFWRSSVVFPVRQVEQGSLYPALYRLEEREWIESEWGLSDNNRKAKFYKLTPDGRKQLVEERSNWERLSTAVNLVLKTT